MKFHNLSRCRRCQRLQPMSTLTNNICVSCINHEFDQTAPEQLDKLLIERWGGKEPYEVRPTKENGKNTQEPMDLGEPEQYDAPGNGERIN